MKGKKQKPREDRKTTELRIKVLQLETEVQLWKERHKLEERFWRVITTLLDSRI